MEILEKGVSGIVINQHDPQKLRTILKKITGFSKEKCHLEEVLIKSIKPLGLSDRVCIDTTTRLEQIAEPWIFANILASKNRRVKHLKEYGWNEGYYHLYNAMRLILQDCDNLIHQGKNVILTAQSSPTKVAYAGG